MQYILVLIGYFPEYINFTINSILSVDKNSKIIICTDQNIDFNFKRLEIINAKDLNSTFLEILKDLNIYENSIFNQNPLWSTSLERIFYLEAVMNYANLNNCIHFDNDVIIYKSFEELEKEFEQDKLNITSYNDKKLVFGYSYIPKQNLINNLCQNIIDLLVDSKNNDWNGNNGKPYNEMELLSLAKRLDTNKFKLLPSLPYESQQIFDPAGYGQYLDGTHAKPYHFLKKRYATTNDPIGVEIISKRIKVRNLNQPIVMWNNEKFELANLHVHSKRLFKFLPKEYTDFIN